MKYSDIRTILAIYEERSFTAAAKRLFISQPAVSQIVSQLEKELNLLLFVRNNGEIIPTEACETFVHTAREIVDLWQNLEKEMSSYNSEHLLRIGTTSFFFQFFSFDSKSTLAQQYPDIEYNINIIEDTASNIERLTYDGQLDFCFTRLPLHQSTLKYEPLFTEEILFAVPVDHPVCKRFAANASGSFSVIDLKEFRSSDFIMVNNPRITPLCHKMCEAAGYRPKTVMQPVSWEHVISGIRSGRGVGFLSNLHIKKEYSDKLRYFHIDSKYATMEQVVAYRSTYRISNKARYFIDSFREFVQHSLTEIEQ